MKSILITGFLLCILNCSVSAYESKSPGAEQASMKQLRLIQNISEPQKAVTRYELAMILCKAFPASRTKHECLGANLGIDLFEEHWAYEAVKWVCGNGILSPYNAGNFSGDKSNIRGEYARVFDLLLLHLGEQFNIEFPRNTREYPDVPPQHWMSDSVANVSVFFVSRADGKWHGGELATRREIVSAVNAIIEYINSNSPLIQPISNNEPIHEPGCPDGMALISASSIGGTDYCIDFFEYPNIRGQKPSGYMTNDIARFVCELEGKRLCKESEWYLACSANDANRYVFGNDHDPAKCNDGSAWCKEPDNMRLKESGAMPDCRTNEGVYDMNGNVWEWVESEGRTSEGFFSRGGSFSNEFDKYTASCVGMMPYNEIDYTLQRHGITMGARCCKTPGAVSQ